MSDWSGYPEATETYPSQTGKQPLQVLITPKSAAPTEPPTQSNDPWAGYPVDTQAKPEEAPVTTEGLAKAFGVGTAQGLIGLPGMVGDLQQLGKKAVDYVAEKLPSIPQTDIGDWWNKDSEKFKIKEPDVARGDLGVTYPLPTSQDIQGAIEKVTGPFRQPENQAERDAATAGNFAAQLVLPSKAGIVQKAFQAAVPAAADIVAGRYSNQNPYVKALAAFVGGVGVNALTAPSSAETILRGRIPKSVTEQDITRAGQLMDHARSRGVSLTWPEALTRVTGYPVLTDTQRILESHARTRPMMDRFFAGRPEALANAAKTEFSNVGALSPNPSYIGPQLSQTAESAIRGVRDLVTKVTRPSYTAAGRTLVTPGDHMQMIANPLFADALKSVRDNPAKNANLRGLSDRSLQVYDAVKQELEERAQNAAKLTNPSASQTVAGSTGKLAGDVRQTAINTERNAVQGPGHYERALGEQQRLREKYLNPALAGPLGKIADQPETKQVIEALFSANPLPGSEGEITRVMNTLVAKRPAAAEQLVRAHAEMVFNEAAKDLQGGANQFGGAKFAKVIAGNDQQRANLKAAVEALPNGTDRWKGFEHLLDIMAATGTRQPKGSLTAFNALEIPSMSTGGLQKVAALGLSPGKWWTAATDTFQGWTLGKNMDQLARVITDPRYGPALKQIISIPPSSDRAVIAAGKLFTQLGLATTQQRLQPAQQ